MTIDFIYDDACPNVERAREHLRAALEQVGRTAVWVEHRIGDPDVPARARGYGSPSILVDGRDVAGDGSSAEQCCRIYADGDGVPPVAWIVRALES